MYINMHMTRASFTFSKDAGCPILTSCLPTLGWNHLLPGDRDRSEKMPPGGAAITKVGFIMRRGFDCALRIQVGGIIERRTWKILLSVESEQND
jgi:hypothetical protein